MGFPLNTAEEEKERTAGMRNTRIDGLVGAPRHLELDPTVSSNLLLNPRNLTLREVGQARIVAVIHVVVDGVRSILVGSSASVASGRATESRLSFSWCVVNLITTVATTLEGMVETEPMSGLVRERCTEVELLGDSTREGGVHDHDSVVHGSILVLVWERGIAQGTILEVDGVDVEGGFISYSKSVLHISLLLGLEVYIGEPRHRAKTSQG